MVDVVATRDLYIGEDLWCAEGEVLSKEQLAFAYSREGRRALGVEFPNPLSLEPPIGFVPSDPLHVQIANMVRRELASRETEEFDTDEDADDFDVDDDFDPTSPWEEYFLPNEAPPGAPGHQPPTGDVPSDGDRSPSGSPAAGSPSASPPAKAQGGVGGDEPPT